MAFDFDVVSNLPGPKIDIQLYPTAASAGGRAGAETPSVVSSILQGVETGVNLYGKFQQIQARAAEQPIREKILEEQAEGAALQNEIRTLELETETALQDVAGRSKKAELENTLTLAKQKADDLKNQDTIVEDLLGTDILRKQNIFGNSDYKDTLLRNPKFGEQVAGELVRQGLLNPEQQRNIFAALDFSKKMAYDQELARINATYQREVAQQRDAALKDLVKTAPYQYAAAQGNLSTVDDVQKRVEVFPKGVKATNEKGLLLSDVPDKPQDPADYGRYTLFLDKKPLLDISEKDAGVFNAFKNAVREETQTARNNIFGISSPAASPPAPARTAVQETPSVISGNQQIVEQARERFEALKKDVPSGMDQGTLEERLKTQKEKIRQGIAALKQNRAAEQGINTYTAAIDAQAAATATAVPLPSPFPPAGGATEKLSSVLKRPVSLSFENQPKVPAATWKNVQTDPLLSSETAIIKGLAAVESEGIRKAVSPTGVKGLLQVTRATASYYGLNERVPEENVLAGKLYLYDNLLRFNGNLMLSLAAYNAGHGTISDAIRAVQSTDWSDIRAYLEATLSPKKYKEVSAYPEKVVSMAAQFLGNGGENDEQFLYLLTQNNLLRPIAT